MAVIVDSLEPRRLFAGAGQLDPDFAPADVPISAKGYAPRRTDAAVDAQGRTLLAGYYSSRRQLSVTRLNVDGTVDATFGTKGIASFGLADADRDSLTFEVAADSRGRVLLLIDRKLVRLNADGGVDRKFGTRGALVPPIVYDANDVVVDARDNVLIVGTSLGKTGMRATIVRVGAARGATDTSFGSGGAYKTPVPQDANFKQPGRATGTTAKVLDDGRIVAVADVYYDASGDNTRNINGVSLFRLDAAGDLDASYGDDGSLLRVASGDEYRFNDVGFEAFYDDGGAILATSEVVSDGIGGGSSRKFWTQVTNNGHVKRERFNVVPKSLAAQTETSGARVRAIQPDGKLLVTASNGLFYRLHGGFALDASFTVSNRDVPADVFLRKDDAILTNAGRASAISL